MNLDKNQYSIVEFSIGFGLTWENFEMCMFVRLARNSSLTRSAPRNRRKPQAAHAHYVWFGLQRSFGRIWSEYTRIIRVLSDAK